MANIQIDSIHKPFDSPENAMRAVEIIHKADAMGLLKDVGTIRTLDARSFGRVIKKIDQAGLAKGQLAGKISLEKSKLTQTLDKIVSALDGSPVPDSEWDAVLQILGSDLTAQLLHLSESSIRRYAAGERQTPQDVASRLHFLAILIGYLRAGYNEYGIRRWFVRPRNFLKQKSVVDVFKEGWDPDGEPAKAIENDARWVAS